MSYPAFPTNSNQLTGDPVSYSTGGAEQSSPGAYTGMNYIQGGPGGWLSAVGYVELGDRGVREGAP